MNLTIDIPQGSTGSQPQTFEAGRYLIGRAPECDIPISGSELVSWNHAEISVRSDGVYLRDLQSSNGTYLNDRKLPVETKIFDGDEVRLGQSGPRLIVQRIAGIETDVTGTPKQSAEQAAPGGKVSGNGPVAFAGGRAARTSQIETSAPLADGRQSGGPPQTKDRGPAASPQPSAGGPPSGDRRPPSSTRAILMKMQRTQRGWRGVGITVGVLLAIGLIVAIVIFALRPDPVIKPRRIPASSDIDMAAISEANGKSVFLVAGMKGEKVLALGTSFVVDSKGVFGTNAHVTELVKEVKQRDSRIKLYVIGEGGKQKFEILKATSHPEYKKKLPPKTFCPDVGLLTVKLPDGEILKPVPLGDDSDVAELKDGAKLCYIGFPVYFGAAGDKSRDYGKLSEVKPRLEAGNVVRLLTLKGQVGTAKDQFIMEHNMQSWGGASGSPIFNRHGRVIALHFAARPVINKTKGGFLVLKSPAGTKFGIRVDKLRELMRN